MVYISICVPAIYKIVSRNFPYDVNINVRSGVPDVGKSSCTMKNNSATPNIKVPGGKVTFECILKDTTGTPIDAGKASNGGLKVQCIGENKTYVASGNNINVASPRFTTNGFECDFSPTKIGTYSVIGQFQFNSSWQNIPASISTFNGLLEPNLDYITAYSWVSSRWFNTEEIKTQLMTATYPHFTQIAFTDASGNKVENRSLLFEFKIENMSATVTNAHDTSYTEKLTVEWVYSGVNTYVGFKLDKPVTWIKKSTAEYKVEISYNGKKTTVRVQKSPGNTNGEVVCVHDLLASKTSFRPTNAIVKANEDTLLGTVITRTTDGNLYNYAIDTNRFKSSYSGIYFVNQDVEGFYDMKIKTKTAGEQSTSVQLDSDKFIGDYKFKVLPEPLVSKFIAQNTNKFKDQSKNILNDFTADQEPVIFNSFRDRYENPLAITPDSGNQFLGLSVSAKITLGLDVKNHAIRFDTKTMNIELDKDTYKLIDYFKYAGKYEVTLKGITGETLTYSYEKLPGAVSVANSSFVSKTQQVEYGKSAEIHLVLKDKFGNNIQYDANLLDQALKNVKVTAILGNSDKIIVDSFKKSSSNDQFIVLTSDAITTAQVGNFIIKVEYSGNQVGCSQNCGFNLAYNNFHYPNSEMRVISGTTKLLTTSTAAQVKNSIEEPIFSMLFFDEKKVQLKYVDPNTVISARIWGQSGVLNIPLEKEWKNKNEMLFTINKNNLKTFQEAPSKQEYFLEILSKDSKSELKYPLNLLGTAGDEDAGNGDPDYSKTVYDAITKTSIAGTEISYSMELRTKENLRCNKSTITADLFTIENSSNLGVSDFYTNITKGAKNCQFIINVMSKKVFYQQAPCIIKVLSNNKEMCGPELNFIVKNHDLYLFKMPDSVFKDKEKGVLLDSMTTKTHEVTFYPYDKYDNLYSTIFDRASFSIQRIVSLFELTHSDGGQLDVKALTYYSNFRIQTVSRKVGVVTIKSQFLDKAYTFTVGHGPAHAAFSFGNLLNTGFTMVAGETAQFLVTPVDEYNNVIPIANLKDTDYENYKSIVVQPRTTGETAITTKSKKEKGIEFSVKLSEAGANNFNGKLLTTPFKNCLNCQLTIVNDKWSYSHSLLYLEENNTERLIKAKSDGVNNMDHGKEPTFNLYVYDQFGNKFSKVPSDFTTPVASFKNSEDNQKLCVKNIETNFEIVVCDDEVSKQEWKYLISEKVYNLEIVYSPGTDKEKKLTYDVKLTGGPNNEDASNADIDVNQTWFSVEKIDTTAGEFFTFIVELRTSNGKRKNYVYPKPQDHIRPFRKLDNESARYKHTVEAYGKPGQYKIKVYSEKKYLESDKNTLQLELKDKDATKNEWKLCETTTLPYKVFNDIPTKGELVSTSLPSHVMITELPKGNADNTYTVGMRLFDQFGNIADFDPININYSYTTPSKSLVLDAKVVKNLDLTYFFTVSPTISGDYSFTTKYINDGKAVTFNVESGAPHENNSLLVAPNTSIAGQEVKVFIIPYDVNGNYVDPKRIESNPYKLAFKYQVDKDNFSKYEAINPAGTEITDSKNAFLFKVALIRRDLNYFKATLGEDKVIKTQNGITNVSPSSPVYENFLFQRMNPESSLFEEMKNDVQYTHPNLKADPIFRIFPRDAYFNSIDKIAEADVFTAVCTEDKVNGPTSLLINNSKGKKDIPYVEIIKDSSKENKNQWNNLVKGQYVISFTKTDEKKTVSKKLSLAGDLTDSDADNEDLDISKTAINESVLKFKAGNSGYLIIELKTKTGMRRNDWANYEVKVESALKDANFVSSTKKAGKKGVFYVDVQSTLANNFPSPGFDFPIKVLVNGEEVKALTPKMDISPNDTNSCEVLKDYIQSKTDSKVLLNTGTADNALFFKVQCRDAHKNICMSNAEEIKLTVQTPDKSSLEFSNGKEVLTGLVTYTVPATISGTYLFSADTKYLSLQHEYLCKPGALNRKKSILLLESKQVSAGDKAYFYITPRDQYGNVIPADSVLTEFEAEVTTDTNQKVKSTREVKDVRVQMSAVLTERDNNTWAIQIMKELVECNSCITTVKAGHAVLKNTAVNIIPYGKLTSVVTPFGTKLTQHNRAKIQFTLNFRDAYLNIIPEIDGSKLSFKKKPTLSGMDMAPIEFDVALPGTKVAYTSEIKEASMIELKHLVAGEEYNLDFSVEDKDTKDSYDINYPIKLLSDTDDSGHGNGPFVVESTHISKDKMTIFAGNKEVFDVTLKTKKGLIYNNDISLEKIKYILAKEDKSFTWDVSKKPNTTYGVYTVVLSSTLLNNKPSLTIETEIENLTGNKEKVPTKINLVVNPGEKPSKKYTLIMKKPLPNSDWDKDIEFHVKLSDDYNNLYEGYEELKPKLFVKRDGKTIETETKLMEDKVTFRFLYAKPIPYPPRDSKFEIFYKDDKLQYDLSDSMETHIVSQPYPQETQFRGKNIQVMRAGEQLDFQVSLFDANKKCVDNEFIYPLKLKITGPLEDEETSRVKVEYDFTKITPEKNEGAFGSCSQYYNVNSKKEDYNKLGTYSLELFAGTDQVKVIPEANGKKQPIIQTLTPDVLDITKFVAKWTIQGDFDAKNIPAGRTLDFKVNANDRFMNPVNDAIKGKFTVEFLPFEHASDFLADRDYSVISSEKSTGQIDFTVKVNKSGPYRFIYGYNKEDFFHVDTSNGPLDIVIRPGSCSRNNPQIDISQLNTIYTGDVAQVVVRCVDDFKNKIGIGGEKFSGIINVSASSTNISSQVNSNVTDNKDGTYTISFTPQIEGKYDIIATLDNKKYGNLETVEIKDYSCQKDKPVKCPNNPKICSASPYDCIEPKNDCPTGTPFKCKIKGNEQCTSSQKDCDCPDGQVKCPISGVCVDSNKQALCPFNLPINCAKLFPTTPFRCPDGICRKNDKECPSQRVCPIGYLMCPDMSCRKDSSECFKYEPCGPEDVKCMDQTCVTNQKDCPNTITCPKKGQFVCPDGECVDNEVFCKPLPKCTAPNGILCPNNTCSSSVENCPKTISCNHGKALCQDIICREQCNNQALRMLFG